MITITLIILILALLLFTAVAWPLLQDKRDTSAAPEGDPRELDLSEERDALYRSIHEVEARADLSPQEREGLRARYEAKAAQVLRALDEHQRQAVSQQAALVAPAKAAPLRIPATALVLGATLIVSVSLLGSYVVPRVAGTTVTSADPLVLEAGRELQRLERDVDQSPNGGNLLALAEAYWRQGHMDMSSSGVMAPGMAEEMADFRARAADTYRRIVEEVQPVPGLAYRRLAALALTDDDIDGGLRYLELAREVQPQDLDTLYTLGQVYAYLNRLDEAVEVWEAYLEAPGEHLPDAEEQLVNARTLAPLARTAEAGPTADNLIALADAQWELDQRPQATGTYLRVLQTVDAQHPQVARRLGEMLFFSGSTNDAIRLLEVARRREPDNLEGLLFLGNAYFAESRLEEAIEAWEAYVEVAGGAEQAGRVPGLIAQAQNQLAGGAGVAEQGGAGPLTAVDVTPGEQLFAAHCAACHGADGRGATGPRLLSNLRAADAAVVQQIVEGGRGRMPAFGDIFSDTELEALTRYIVQLASR